MANETRSEVGGWYAGRSVLITGATGFLGGVLVEKLLRASPQVDKLYLLIRPKTGQMVADRVKKLLKAPLFSKHSAEVLSKVVGISGDVSAHGLSLGTSDKSLLLDEVSVVFHSAASINFNAALTSAMQTNTMGTQRILQLAHQMKKLEALVYVSTAYCNCTRNELITEKVFPSEYAPRDVMELMEKLTPEEFAAETQRLVGRHPNTYSFTKLLAENLLRDERGDVPVAIVRPTIVLSTASEPMPGWVDNVTTGAFAFIAGASRGIFRTAFADKGKVVDFVPCDYVTNLMIASAWKVSKDRCLSVYHCSSGTLNPMRWGEYIELVVRLIREYPCGVMFWYPGAKLREQEWRNDLATYLFHIIPAHVAETFAKLSGRKMILSLLAIQQKYSRGQKHVAFFTRRDWQFDSTSTQKLADHMTSVDRKLYNFDVTSFKWNDFIKSNVFGLRHFFHKESPTTMAASKVQLRWWRLLNVAAFFFLFLSVWSMANVAFGNQIIALIVAALVTIFIIWL